MISIRPFEIADIDLIGEAAHDRLSIGHFAKSTLYRMALKKAGPAFTGFENERILGAAGIIILWAGVGQAWVYLGKSAIDRPLTLHRTIKRGLSFLIEQYDLRRVQTEVLKNDARARVWIERLDFLPEGDMPGYGVQGETYIRYGRVRYGTQITL